MDVKPAQSVYTLVSLSFLLSALGLGVLLLIVIEFDNLFWAILEFDNLFWVMPVSFLFGLSAAIMGYLARKQLEGIEGARPRLRMATIGMVVGLLECISVIITFLTPYAFVFLVCNFGVGC